MGCLTLKLSRERRLADASRLERLVRAHFRYGDLLAAPVLARGVCQATCATDAVWKSELGFLLRPIDQARRHEAPEQAHGLARGAQNEFLAPWTAGFPSARLCCSRRMYSDDPSHN